MEKQSPAPDPASNADTIEKLRRDLEALTEQNNRLQAELELREEMMQNLFSYLTTRGKEKV